jgi:hypothetical protein
MIGSSLVICGEVGYSASPNARHPYPRRRADRNAARPPRAQHLRPVRNHQADGGRQGPIPLTAEPWADTGTSTGRLMIAVLGGLADVERDLIRTRTAEGRSRTKAQRQYMGRPPALSLRHNRKRPPDAARRALRSTNAPAATMWAYPPFAARPAPHELDLLLIPR